MRYLYSKNKNVFFFIFFLRERLYSKKKDADKKRVFS